MKNRFTLYAYGFLILAFAVLPMSCSSRKDDPDTFQDLPGLLSAIEGFTRDLIEGGRPVPVNVSLEEVVKGGYISSHSVQAFDGMETRIWLGADPGVPSSVLISSRLPDGTVLACLPDGTVLACLADGSVQQFSSQQFVAHLERTSQPSGAINGSEPFPSGTNSTSPAAGARR